jgi:hypothetical protein
MKLLITGEEEEITIALQRFLDLNKYKCSLIEGRVIFYKVYNISYSIKVILR